MFKDIQGYEGLYWIDHFGNILTKNWRNTGKRSMLKPAADTKGYLRVALMKDGILTTHKVHRLVAIHFVPNPNNKPQVNHKDGIKSNNHYTNLEWCTGKENMQHAYNNGLSYKLNPVNKIPKAGELNGQSLLTAPQVMEIRNKFKPRLTTRKELAIEYGVTESCIKDIVARKSWKHI